MEFICSFLLLALKQSLHSTDLDPIVKELIAWIKIKGHLDEDMGAILC